MPGVILNPTIKELRGAMDDFVFRTSPNGKVYLSKRPDMSKVNWSNAQKESRQRFKDASSYARAALADPQVRAIYEERAVQEHRIPYRVALSDYLKGNNLLPR
jgi:hypothetical protein